MSAREARPPGGLPRLYRDLAAWYPLLTPPEDYAEEAETYRLLARDLCEHPARTLLDLGCGGGHNASHLKRHFTATLVDLSPAMLEVSRALNPECEHVLGDMRTVRLGRSFDVVLVHDAVVYMATPEDLARAVGTAFAHCASGGVALFVPDYVRETFAPGTETGGSDSGGRGARYLEWRWCPEETADRYVTDMVYLLREADGTVQVEYDRHVMGLFARATWLETIAAAGFEARTVPFEHSTLPGGTHEIFVGLRRGGPRGPGRGGR